MLEVLEHNRCTGCSACYTACAHNAITMQYDEEGFEYPVVNQDVCIDCGLCQITCPVFQYDKRKTLITANNDAQVGYAAKNKNYPQRLIRYSRSIFKSIAD